MNPSGGYRSNLEKLFSVGEISSLETLHWCQQASKDYLGVWHFKRSERNIWHLFSLRAACYPHNKSTFASHISTSLPLTTCFTTITWFTKLQAPIFSCNLEMAWKHQLSAHFLEFYHFVGLFCMLITFPPINLPFFLLNFRPIFIGCLPFANSILFLAEQWKLHKTYSTVSVSLLNEYNCYQHSSLLAYWWARKDRKKKRL